MRQLVGIGKIRFGPRYSTPTSELFHGGASTRRLPRPGYCSRRLTKDRTRPAGPRITEAAREICVTTMGDITYIQPLQPEKGTALFGNSTTC